MKLLPTLLIMSLFCITHTTNISFASTLITSKEASKLLMFPTHSSPAQVVALNQSLIPAQTSGVLIKLMVNVGDKVVKGEVLASLDCDINILNHRAQSATYEQIYSQLLFNKRELVRGRTLLTQKNIGEATLDRLKNAVENSRALIQSQKAAVETASLNVERCNTKAPYNGVITKRIASLGEMLSVGKPIVEIIEDNRLEVSAKIALSDEVSFNQAKNYTVEIAQTNYPVTLRAFLPFIESNTRSREARFIFIEQQPMAGSSGRLRWQSPIAYLPAHLLQKRNGENGYFITENNKAKFVIVELAEEGRPISFNLPHNTQIITEGRHGLTDGDIVSTGDKT